MLYKNAGYPAFFVLTNVFVDGTRQNMVEYIR